MSTRQLVAGSMVAGLAVWAKPQSGPIAVAFVAACVLITCVENGPAAQRVRLVDAGRFVLRSGLVAVLAFATPTLVFVGVMALGGTLDDLVREPLAAMWNYTAHRDESEGFVAPGFSDRLADIAREALRGRPIELACVAISVAVVSAVLVVRIPTGVDRLTTLNDPLAPSATDATSLSTDCPTGSRVLVWGWAAELYSSYDWTPASRYVNATWQIFPNRRQAEWSSIHRGARPPREFFREFLRSLVDKGF